jgi:glycosyltransferase involved in cell wall biosynthesis
MRPLDVAIVMPPVTELPPHDAVTRWASVTRAASALQGDGRVHPVVHGRHRTQQAVVEYGGVEYHFHTSDGALATALATRVPHVVHVHGLGWSRVLRRLHGAVPSVPLVVQHHGELPFRGRAKLGHRAVRRHIAGYLFTGASTGQVQPWIDEGVIARDARCFEVLEAASLLPDDDSLPVMLEGSPSILWVGRLVDGKDPLTAVSAFALAASTLPDAHLHLLATDRTLESQVRTRAAELGLLAQRIHIHDPVPSTYIKGWYEAATIFFSTSRHEGSGYSLIEALTCGCVPVVSDIPPHRAIVGDFGARFPVGDVHAAAVSLATCSRFSRVPSRDATPTIVSWGRVVEQLVDAYSSVVQGTVERN